MTSQDNIGIAPVPVTKPPRRTLRRFFFRGLILLLPTIITVWVLAKIIGFLQHNVVQYLGRVVTWIFWLAGIFTVHSYGESQPPIERSVAMVIAWILSVGFVLFAGLVFGSWIGRRLWTAIENFLIRFPVIRFVYPHVKQVTDFVFSPDRKLQFTQVVAIQYPRPGLWSVAFLTGSALPEVSRVTGVECLSVFVPSSPTPLTGYIVFVPRDEVVLLSMAMEDALKLVISGGVISPRLLTRSTASGSPGQ